MIKDLFAILVIVNVNMIKREMLVNKLVDECTEVIEEVKLAEITLAENENNYKCSSCSVYCIDDSIFLQFLWELLLILFITIGL